MPLSASDIEWLLQRNGAEPGIWLATVTGPEVGGTIRLARNTEDFTSRGEVFKASPFDVEMPSDTAEQPRATVTIPNPDREVGLTLLETTSGLTMSFELVRPSFPDNVIYAARALKLRTVQIDPLVVQGELSAVTYDTEPYIGLRVSPSKFPGLYRLQ